MHNRSKFALLPLTFLVLALTTVPALAGPPPFTTTELIAGNNAPAVNGANLLAAVAAAAPNTLIKLEPGVYDLSGQQIFLPNFVDIEGSGRDITTIVSDLTLALTPSVVEVSAGINGEIRQLTIQAFAGSATAVTARSDEFLLTEVNLEVEGDNQAIGVAIRNASPRVNETFVRVLGSNSNATGILIEGAGAAAVTDSLVFGSNVQRNFWGVLVDDSQPVLETVIVFSIFNGSNTGVALSGDTTEATIRNTRATVQGSRAAGLYMNKQSNARVKESSFVVRSDDFAAGVLLEEASAKITESTFDVAQLTLGHFNIFGAQLTGPSNLDSNQSNYESTVFAVSNAGTGQARFGASQLIGIASPAVFGPLVCAQSYNGAYAAINNFCN